MNEALLFCWFNSVWLDAFFGIFFLFSEAELDLVTSSDWQTPEPYYHTLESPENLGKPALELMPEDVSKQDVYPSVPSEPLDPILSCQIKKTRQSKSVNSSRKQLNDSDSLDSKGSVGREFPPNNLSLDDLVRYINGESLKKVCNRKNQPTALPQTTTVNTKKSKKQPVKKHDVATTSKARVSPATNRLRKTTKNPGHAGVVGPGEFTEDSSSPQEVFCDVDVIPNRSAATTGMTASVKEETAFASDAEHEDESAGQEEFVAVLHKKRVKGRREPHLKQDTLSACTVSPQTKVAGRQPGSASARIDKDLGASTMSVFSVSSKSYRSDTSGGSIASKRDSLSSLDESPPLPAAYDSSAFGSSTGNQEHARVPPFRPSFSKFSAGNSYASALLQNMPKLSVTGSPEVSHTETGTVEGAAFSSPLNSEAESEMLLSPPQSEADTGFSSSSSLSPDEIHVSLASDSAVMLSKVNQVVDSESSMLKCTADDVHYEILEQPREECIVQDSVSCCVTNIDFPLTRISELSGRTDKAQLNAGESSLACSSCDLSCADAPSKNAPVIFDTRIRAVAHKTSNSDIVFLFDAEDSVADASSNVGNYVPVDDIDGITFTSSPDSMPLETSALEKASSNYIAALDASSDTRTIGECGSFELTDKPVFDPRWGIRVTGDQSSCNEHIARDSEHERPPVNGRKLVERSVAEVLYSAPGGGFDLLAAQKFISQGEYFHLMFVRLLLSESSLIKVLSINIKKEICNGCTFLLCTPLIASFVG